MNKVITGYHRIIIGIYCCYCCCCFSSFYFHYLCIRI